MVSVKKNGEEEPLKFCIKNWPRMRSYPTSLLYGPLSLQFMLAYVKGIFLISLSRNLTCCFFTRVSLYKIKQTGTRFGHYLYSTKCSWIISYIADPVP